MPAVSSTKKKKKKDKCGCDCKIGYISRNNYRQHLKDHHLLLGKNDEGRDEDTEVAHIIANANGGPDHRDNYLFVYGGSFNRKTKENYDHIQCYLAGKDRTIKAVEIALEVAENESLQSKELGYIEWRNNKKPTIFTESTLYKENNFSSERGSDRARRIGEKLYKKGLNEWEAFAKTSDRTSVCCRYGFAKGPVDTFKKLELLIINLKINIDITQFENLRNEADERKKTLKEIQLFGQRVKVNDLKAWVLQQVPVKDIKPRSNIVPHLVRPKHIQVFPKEKTKPLAKEELDSPSGDPIALVTSSKQMEGFREIDKNQICGIHLNMGSAVKEYRGTDRKEGKCIAQTNDGLQCQNRPKLKTATQSSMGQLSGIESARICTHHRKMGPNAKEYCGADRKENKCIAQRKEGKQCTKSPKTMWDKIKSIAGLRGED